MATRPPRQRRAGCVVTGGAPRITAEMARELAVAEKVCVRPILRRVLDRDTGTDTTVAIPCGSTREAVCPACAHKARVLRMQQCAEGWHRTTEPEPPDSDDEQPGDDELADDDAEEGGEESERRVRSTRRRQDAADLPRVPVEDRTVGRVFTAPDGREYRPSMFLTVTLPSYGPITPGAGVPVDPSRYDYRRAALDALHFPKLVDRFIQNLRRCAGYKVQYFAAVEPQTRLAPHLHAALRGAIPRDLLRKVIRATYVQVWWPAHDTPVYAYRLPVWTGTGYADPDTGAYLPTWEEALDQLAADPDAKPAHTMRFGRQMDMRGIIAPSADADRAIRYLTKYLTKAITDPLTTTAPDSDADGEPDAARVAHIDRLHAELRYLPCSPRCSNWLRYGIQPDHAGPGMCPGRCPGKAHDRDHCGVGGRRVLVSRQWSGKTLAGHRADRATVVREALLSAGILAPEIERMAADTLAEDGKPRFIWTDTRPDLTIYTQILVASVVERQQWRQQYEGAKTAAASAGRPVDSVSATAQPP